MSYIEKEATISNLKALKKYWGSTLTAQGIGKAIEEIEKMQEVNIAETSTIPTPTPTTPKGYWEETVSVTKSKNGREVHSTVYACSECKATNGRKKDNYCHNCGADMRGEENEKQAD